MRRATNPWRKTDATRVLSELVRWAERAPGTAEQAAFGAGGGKPFLRPFRDQIPLDLGEEPEQGDHRLGLHVLLSLKVNRTVALAIVSDLFAVDLRTWKE